MIKNIVMQEFLHEWMFLQLVFSEPEDLEHNAEDP